jgi:UDP-N-acetylmuramoyl-tripeptide--D-alanyl-D-alanine ligase
MAELDHDAVARHRAMADHARALNIEVVPIATADYGVDPCPDLGVVLDQLGDGDAVLFKGSRVAGLEQLAHQLFIERSRD